MGSLKKVIGLGLAGLIVLSLGAGATLAYASDSQDSLGNQVAAGTLDLWTNGTDGTTQNIYVPSLKPGGSTGEVTITLTNHGTRTGTSLSVSVAYSESDATPNPGLNMSADDVAARIEITKLEYDWDTWLGTVVTDKNANGYYDLQDFKNCPFTLTGSQGTLNGGASKDLKVTMVMRPFGSGTWNVTNDYMGDGVSADITFTLNQ